MLNQQPNRAYWEIAKERLPLWRAVLEKKFYPLSVDVRLDRIEDYIGVFDITFRLYSSKNQLGTKVRVEDRIDHSFDYLHKLFEGAMDSFDETIRKIAIDQIINGTIKNSYEEKNN